MRLTILTAMLLLSGPVLADNNSSIEADAEKALRKYVQRTDEAFQWQHLRTTRHAAGTVHELRVTSQNWHDILWKHAVEIYEPRSVDFPRQALLFVTGGSTPSSPSEGDIAQGLQLATLCGARVIMLHQTPNQPLLGDRKEDDLISETWLKYLESGDDTWPLLFPMVKSAVKTMDAVEAFSRSRFSEPIQEFVITGASKRGWTSWLTPVADGRVIATAPIVIDVLNFRAQMNHQLATWGNFSLQINDYTSKGLVRRPDETETPREVALRTMMDPFTYRKQLTLPKLLIVGTNDPYWVVDAMNLYWDDLEGGKYIRQIPNAGHGLEGGQEQAMLSLAVFFRHVAGGQPMPTIRWEASEQERQLRMAMGASAKPATVRFWSARSEDQDFRDARWISAELPETNAQWLGSAELQDGEHVAVFGEFEFDFSGYPWSLTTLVYRK